VVDQIVVERPLADGPQPPVVLARSDRSGHSAALPLVDAVGRIGRLLGRLKSDFTARHPRLPAEYGAFSLLTSLVDTGPMRAGALADAVLMDPSQVSRRVAELVRAGLVERRADSGDGRAIVLVATSEGRALCASLRSERAAYFRGIVEDWPASEIDAFVGYLDRFATSLERTVQPSRSGSAAPAAPGWDPRPVDR